MPDSGKTHWNIVFILSDDQGAWALGCNGNKEIITPHLDGLAATGVFLNNFFCTSPVCSPARASLFTGRIPSDHGIHDWIREGNCFPDGTSYLGALESYADYLAQQGYVCALSGKWHMGNSHVPHRNFSHWYAHQKGGGDYYRAPMVRDGNPVIESQYITDLITDDAINFIKQQKNSDKPFYLSVHYTAPHSPWNRVRR
ncbi:MAG: sulfatase-like hydrolase/transferase [Sphaerochaetaceae bacterium]|nr:sulfatase-like hydrolase/transferase [Sphaerochaetaceae bacterium]MDD4260547.1 sulfatase-like hydrolase/transferase [Sphaerochaetaceae bacterium]MDD4841601.1 sulfatase-like hydrolase/transferase [Sphaerochaetaceae bacterium]